MLIFETVQNSFKVFLLKSRKKKWLLSCSCNPNRNNIINHMKDISTGLGQFRVTYNNLILIGDLNNETEEDNMLDFLNIYNLENLVKQKTCYKNPGKALCIDLILTICYRS